MRQSWIAVTWVEALLSAAGMTTIQAPVLNNTLRTRLKYSFYRLLELLEFDPEQTTKAEQLHYIGGHLMLMKLCQFFDVPLAQKEQEDLIARVTVKNPLYQENSKGLRGLLKLKREIVDVRERRAVLGMLEKVAPQMDFCVHQIDEEVERLRSYYDRLPYIA